MSTLKTQLEADLRESMKARDELTTSTLRMAIAAVRTAEVAGKQARELTDDEVLGVLTKEAKKRREAAEAFAGAGRADAAAKEQAEEKILSGYLPAQLSDEEISALVTEALSAGGFTSKGQMGPAMKAVQVAIAGRAEGGRVAAEVRRQLG
jgi:uncharacterized protein YqeY